MPRSRKHLLELAYSKRGVWGKCVQPNMTLITLTTVFVLPVLHLSNHTEGFLSYQFCTCLVEWCLAPSAELCAVPSDNGTIFGILELGTLHRSQHFHRCLIRSRTFAGTRRFRTDLFTFLSRRPAVSLVEGNGLELSSRPGNNDKSEQCYLLCLSWHDVAELRNVVGPACK